MNWIVWPLRVTTGGVSACGSTAPMRTSNVDADLQASGQLLQGIHPRALLLPEDPAQIALVRGAAFREFLRVTSR